MILFTLQLSLEILLVRAGTYLHVGMVSLDQDGTGRGCGRSFGPAGPGHDGRQRSGARNGSAYHASRLPRKCLCVVSRRARLLL